MVNSQNSEAGSKLGRIWSDIKRIFWILGASRISIIMVLLSTILLIGVDQIKDTIIALGNFANARQFIIFSLTGMLWAFLVWYWARVFSFIEFHNVKDSKVNGLKPYEKSILEQTPRILGAASLLIIAAAFLMQAQFCQMPGKPNPIRIIGLVFIALTVIFIFIADICKKIFILEAIKGPQQGIDGIFPIKNLPRITKQLLYITTFTAIIFLALLIIFPIHLTIYLGDGVTILIICFCIWLPLFYWVRYLSLSLRFPVFLVLFIIIAVFSLFNGNKNVRLTDQTVNTRMDLPDYYQQWEKQIPIPDRNVSSNQDHRKPMIIVLSEGGGIRATYFSAKLMAHIQTKKPEFRNYLFGISGVSGGSFGATIFDSLVKYYDNHPGENKIEQKTTDIVGKDFLSPIIACMFTREIVQLLIPFPISSFDHAKVFEKTWEYYWKNMMDQDQTFSDPFLTLWKDDSNPANKRIPALFVNVTEVEDGYPVIVSNIDLKSSFNLLSSSDLKEINKNFNIPKDFYHDILSDSNQGRDVRISTASLLSARFPYIGPAGTIIEQNNKTIGLVDGGYFDNSGANTAYRILMALKSWDENEQKSKSQQPLSSADLEKSSIYRSKIRPVIIYLKNGTVTPENKTSGRSMFYQLLAPPNTMLQVRDAHTNNALFRLEEFVRLYNGVFITYSLQSGQKQPVKIPLGWALSKKAQEEIDTRVKEIDFEELSKILNRTEI